MICNSCNTDSKERDVMFTFGDIGVCNKCILEAFSIYFKYVKDHYVVRNQIEWIEAFSIDPRDKKEYIARVNRNDYDDWADAFNAAKQRAYYLAFRGYTEKDSTG